MDQKEIDIFTLKKHDWSQEECEYKQISGKSQRRRRHNTSFTNDPDRTKYSSPVNVISIELGASPTSHLVTTNRKRRYQRETNKSFDAAIRDNAKDTARFRRRAKHCQDLDLLITKCKQAAGHFDTKKFDLPCVYP